MIGVAITAPNRPGLVIVNVAPSTSSGPRRPARARSATSPIAAASPSALSRWASRITGTIRPASRATAIPRWTDSWATISSPSIDELRIGCSPERGDRRLGDERERRQPHAAALHRPALASRLRATADMSTSTTVVQWADVRRLSTMCRAIALRIGDIGSREAPFPLPCLAAHGTGSSGL